MVRQAIRSEGRDAEDAFVRLVPGSQRSDSKSRGDVIVAVDGKNYYVEVKSCHAAVGEQATADQVRPIKYNACVVRTPKRRCWYVMSPDQLVSLAGTKNRGQHCEIPFECLAISLNSLPRRYYCTATDEDLGAAVAEAIRRGARATDAERVMKSLQSEISAVKVKYLEVVRRLDGEQ